MRVASQQQRGRRARARRGSSSMRTPSTCSTSDSFGVQVVRPRYSSSAVARIDEHGNRRGAATAARRRAGSRRRAPASPGRSRSPTAARASHDSRERRATSARTRRLTASASGQPVSRSMRTTCCLRGVDAAGENARLDRRPVRRRAARCRADRRRVQSWRAAGGPRLVAPDQAGQARAAAERRDVVGGVAGAAGHDLGRVVLEDQHRRLARHARDLAVDELVGDEVADDRARGGC